MSQGKPNGPRDDVQRVLDDLQPKSPEYPEGKLTPEDEGALAIAVGVHEGRVILQFAKSTRWIGFGPDMALQIAATLAEHAHSIGASLSLPAAPPVPAIADMTAEQLTEYTKNIARELEENLPPGPSAKGKCLFVLLFTPDMVGGRAQYVSNAERSGMVAMLREAADRIESRQTDERTAHDA